MTLSNIRSTFLKYLVDTFDTSAQYSEDYYDDAGYAGKITINNILSFWTTFSTEGDLKYLLSGKWVSDCIDLQGGRFYFLSKSNVILPIYDYVVANNLYTVDDLNRNLHNSNELHDELVMMLEDREKNKVGLMLQYPKSIRSEIKEKYNLFLIGDDMLDNDFDIYRLDLPVGFKIIESISKHLKRY